MNIPRTSAACLILAAFLATPASAFGGGSCGDGGGGGWGGGGWGGGGWGGGGGSGGGGCGCGGSGGGYELELPETVAIGTSFTTCVRAPEGAGVFILISATANPVQTQYGTLCVGLPLLTYWFLVMPGGCQGELCLDHLVECDPAVVGFEGHFQFAAVGPAPGQVGLSNCEVLRAIDTGKCDPPGALVSFTQGAWGQKCAGDNLGCLRDQEFDHVVGPQLVLGDPDGDDSDGIKALVLTSSKAVKDLLPVGGSPKALKWDETDEDDSEAGVFAGQLVAAKLNVLFDDAGAFDHLKTQQAITLGDMQLAGCVHPALVGLAVRDLVALAEKALSRELQEPFDVDGDQVGDVLLDDLSDALEAVNENFDEGSQNLGCLGYP